MAEFSFTELLPLGHDDTTYRKIGDGGVHRREALRGNGTSSLNLLQNAKLHGGITCTSTSTKGANATF